MQFLPLDNAAPSFLQVINFLSDTFWNDTDHQGEYEHTANSDGERDHADKGAISIGMCSGVSDIGPRLPEWRRKILPWSRAKKGRSAEDEHKCCAQKDKRLSPFGSREIKVETVLSVFWQRKDHFAFC